jgi:hypothetical protein
MQRRWLSIERPKISQRGPEPQTQETGSVFIVALAIVVIAAIITTSCLLYISDYRERRGRLSDQDAKAADLEGEIRSAKENIRHQAVTAGRIDLSQAALPSDNNLDHLSFNVSDGGQNNFITVPSLAGTSDAGDLATPAHLGSDAASDPFAGATAQVLKISVNATATNTPLSTQRTVNKTVTATPEIDVRRIPLSEFTVYSSGNSNLLLDQAVFPGGLGRIFAGGNVNLRGSLFSFYPLVSEGTVNGSGGGQIEFKEGGSSQSEVKLEGSAGAAGDSAWVNEARTRFAAKLITPDVLPVDTALAYNVCTSSNSEGASGLNIVGLGAQCDLTVIVRGQQTPQAFWTKNHQPVAGLTSASKKQARKKDSQAAAPKTPNVVVGTYADEKGVQRTVLALNYATLPSGLTMQSCYLIVNNDAGAPDPNALVLLRSADRLTHPFSVVTPNRLGVEGDFNVGTDKSSAASLITPLDVQAFPVGSFQQLGAAR